jgi:hypothetical protein
MHYCTSQSITASTFIAETEVLPADNVAKVFHRLKTEEALFRAQLQALLCESSKQKTQVLAVLVQRATVDTYVIEVDDNEHV